MEKQHNKQATKISTSSNRKLKEHKPTLLSRIQKYADIIQGYTVDIEKKLQLFENIANDLSKRIGDNVRRISTIEQRLTQADKLHEAQAMFSADVIVSLNGVVMAIVNKKLISNEDFVASKNKAAMDFMKEQKERKSKDESGDDKSKDESGDESKVTV